MNYKKSAIKWTLLIIFTGFLITLGVTALLLYLDRPASYLFYDYENQKWNEIHIEFPNPKMGKGVILIVSSETPIYSLKDDTKNDFILEFNNKFEVTQITGNQEIVSYPQPLDENGSSFILIPPDLHYDDQISVVIGMKEDINFQHELLGDIYLDEFPK